MFGCWPLVMASSCSSILLVIRTSRSAPPCFSAFDCQKTSIFLICLPPPRSSGPVGTCRSLSGSGTTCFFRWLLCGGSFGGGTCRLLFPWLFLACGIRLSWLWSCGAPIMVFYLFSTGCGDRPNGDLGLSGRAGLPL